MKSNLLYIAAMGLHITLLYLFSSLQLHRRNPVFMVWLLAVIFGNCAIWVLYWAKEYSALRGANIGLDVLWYALLAVTLIWAWYDHSAAFRDVIVRGVIAMIVLAVFPRVIAGVHLAGGFGHTLAMAINLGYLVPSAYMIIAFSGVRIDKLPDYLGQISNVKLDIADAAAAAVGVARALMG
jgi:hypothetical protein